MYGDVDKQKDILKYLVEELKLDINEPTKLYGAVLVLLLIRLLINTSGKLCKMCILSFHRHWNHCIPILAASKFGSRSTILMCQKLGADIFVESPKHGDILSSFEGTGYTDRLKIRSSR